MPRRYAVDEQRGPPPRFNPALIGDDYFCRPARIVGVDQAAAVVGQQPQRPLVVIVWPTGRWLPCIVHRSIVTGSHWCMDGAREMSAAEAELGTVTKDLALPIRKLIADGVLIAKGQKRSTKYFPGKKAK